MCSHFKFAGKPCISSPADTRQIIRLAIRPVDSHQKVCDLTSKRCHPIYRRFADIAIQINAVRLCHRSFFPHKCKLPDKYRKNQTISAFFMLIIRTELSVYFHDLPPVALLHIHKPLRNHQRNPILHMTQTVDNHLQHIKAFSKNFMAVCEF